MPHPPLDDPWINAQIEAAVRPYEGRLSAQDLDWMREQLTELLSRDATAAKLLREAHPRHVDESGERIVPGGYGTSDSPDRADSKNWKVG
ncbi:hypothetical protein [Chondromyces crocatus]|uniref:hypothetical protein n=1 Tax=Chondromyces crocatus TaxID=52 RepID=UPI001FE000E6|nr:hypothetical protein [Chondromyces crocatus]